MGFFDFIFGLFGLGQKDDIKQNQESLVKDTQHRVDLLRAEAASNPEKKEENQRKIDELNAEAQRKVHELELAREEKRKREQKPAEKKAA